MLSTGSQNLMRQKQCAVRCLAVKTPGTETVNSSMFRDQNSKLGKRYTAKLTCTVPRSAVRPSGTKKVRCLYSSINPTEQKETKMDRSTLSNGSKKKKKKKGSEMMHNSMFSGQTPGIEMMHNLMFSSQNSRNRNYAQSDV